jgi:hypothetical protein
LVIALVMVLGQVRLEDRAERRLSDHDHLIERFLCDRTHESFAMRVEIRTPWRQDDRFNSAGPQRPVEAMPKLLVPVGEQRSCAQQQAINGIGQRHCQLKGDICRIGL